MHTHHLKKTIILLVIIFSIITGAKAATNTWEGDDATNPTSWNVPANWSSNAVPVSTDDVVIPASLSNYPTLDVSGTIASLLIDDLASLSVDASVSGYTLNVLGNMTLNPGATFTGAANSSLVVGGKLTIQDGNATFTGSTDFSIEIGGDVEVINNDNAGGALTVNGSHLTISGNVFGSGTAGSGTLDAENDDSYIIIKGNMNIVFQQGYFGHSTVEFNGTGAQEIIADAVYFNNLVINNSNGVTANAPFMEIDRNLSGTGQFIGTDGNTIALVGDMSVNTFIANQSTFQLWGSLPLYNGGSAQIQNINSQTFYDLLADNGNTNLTGDITITHQFLFDNFIIKDNSLAPGKVILNNYNLTIATGASLDGADEDEYIVTNTIAPADSSIGFLVMDATTSGTFFPIGISETSYTPITIKPIITDATFQAQVHDDKVTYNDLSIVSTNAVNRTWLVKPISGSAQDVVVTTQWDQTKEQLPDFDAETAYLSYRTRQDVATNWISAVPSPNPGASSPDDNDIYQMYSDSINMANNGTDYFIATGDNLVPLPVTWISFEANRINNAKVNLNWVTASEINNSHFEIERSTDGKRWTKIGRVEGNGNTQAMHTYSFDDGIRILSKADVIYYRLKQVDFNGAHEYSIIRTVRNGLTLSEVQAFPNPVSNILNVSWLNEGDGNTTISLTNVNGRIVYLEEVAATHANQKTIDVKRFPKGIYFLQLISNNGIVYKTININ